MSLKTARSSAHASAKYARRIAFSLPHLTPPLLRPRKIHRWKRPGERILPTKSQKIFPQLKIVRTILRQCAVLPQSQLLRQISRPLWPCETFLTLNSRENTPPPPRPPEKHKPEAKQRALDSDQFKTSPTIRGLLRALKQSCSELTRLMNTITGPQYYRARTLYLQ